MKYAKCNRAGSNAFWGLSWLLWLKTFLMFKYLFVMNVGINEFEWKTIDSYFNFDKEKGRVCSPFMYFFSHTLISKFYLIISLHCCIIIVVVVVVIIYQFLKFSLLIRDFLCNEGLHICTYHRWNIYLLYHNTLGVSNGWV